MNEGSHVVKTNTVLYLVKPFTLDSRKIQIYKYIYLPLVLFQYQRFTHSSKEIFYISRNLDVDILSP